MSTDLAEQTRVTLENVAKVLEAAGTSLEHVVTIGVFLSPPILDPRRVSG
jgi:enamine deaminase RidA (YjgF/YER057c/UK114 family)